jgi:hypothetical protein
VRAINFALNIPRCQRIESDLGRAVFYARAISENKSQRRCKRRGSVIAAD